MPSYTFFTYTFHSTYRPAPHLSLPNTVSLCNWGNAFVLAALAWAHAFGSWPRAAVHLASNLVAECLKFALALFPLYLVFAPSLDLLSVVGWGVMLVNNYHYRPALDMADMQSALPLRTDLDLPHVHVPSVQPPMADLAPHQISSRRKGANGHSQKLTVPIPRFNINPTHGQGWNDVPAAMFDAHQLGINRPQAPPCQYPSSTTCESSRRQG